MKIKLLQSLPLLILGILSYISYFGLGCVTDPECSFYAPLKGYGPSLLQPALLFSLYALPGAFLAIFTKKEVFKTWFRYSFFWALFSAILIYKIPVDSGSWFSFWWLEKDSIAQFCGILFSVIGALAILIKTLKLKRKKR
ncbi:hypothetical protein KKD81_01195 [Patescibacteria group bacterium]|nr:hypothetical protein [Patescibacteria group bacterium]MBU2159041.1 hypothetical protein [Patescibacteria group bacterium]MBU2220533.1 hypothetical protein [Patescibacteria group bacterium]